MKNLPEKNITQLNKDVLKIIFGFLDHKSLAIVKKVSKLFRLHVSDDLWQKHIREHITTINIPSENCEEFFNNHYKNVKRLKSILFANNFFDSLKSYFLIEDVDRFAAIMYAIMRGYDVIIYQFDKSDSQLWLNIKQEIGKFSNDFYNRFRSDCYDLRSWPVDIIYKTPPVFFTNLDHYFESRRFFSLIIQGNNPTCLDYILKIRTSIFPHKNTLNRKSQYKLNGQTFSGTLMAEAIKIGNLNIVKVLVKTIEKFEPDDFITAIELNREDIASIIYTKLDRQQSIEHFEYVIEKDHANAALFILQKIILSSSAQNEKLYLCLFFAVEKQSVEVVKAFLFLSNKTFLFSSKKLFNVNSRNLDQKTCLHIAAELGNATIVSLLAASGADVNVKDKDGTMALHFAIQSQNLETVVTLLRNGSNPLVYSSKYATPLELAQKLDNQNIIREIQNEIVMHDIENLRLKNRELEAKNDEKDFIIKTQVISIKELEQENEQLKKEKEQILFERQKLKNKKTSVNKSNEDYEDQREEYYSARFLG